MLALAMTAPPAPAATPPAVVYEDDEIQVLHRPGGSAYTLVSFAGRQLTADGRHFWNAEQAARLGLDTLGFVAKRPNWYPTASLARAAAAVAPLGRPLRLGYGIGMGGFGVLKHGRRLGLQRALAIGPASSIDPRLAPWETRLAPFFRPALHPDMWIHRRDLPAWSAAVLDPWDGPERGHAAALAALGTRIVPAPFMAQRVAVLFGGPLQPVLQALQAEDAAGLRHLLRRRRRGSIRWHLRLAEIAAAHGHGPLAERLRQHAAALEQRHRPEPQPGAAA
ncbi:hypothetical protein [Pseudoroseomonas cervicalis]|uniref:hypothetical protein n=1 Tax=Teichococcus cervicalis TaxID=204525 RepID=UPI0022F16A60|nr:hypothetical protein [Pseudoroseomonas cervicalis]WBV42406.1 hypothetical protein PFY06_14330 [Pseudoroseomonas cervicalis]